ncbi:ABC transporter substrate-binding protein [Deinococcus sp.]|uniref:ABC transporter substrate-binding protein n=1 Tax=Deinococcus sp. TaxID=47478 RepID=UPI003B5A5576
MPKKTIFAPLALLCLLTALLPNAQARSLSEIRESGGILQIGTSGDLPPFTYRVGAGYAGFETELMTLLAADLGLKVNFKVVPVDAAIRSLQLGQTDVSIGGLGITSTRASRVNFTQPHACAGMSVVARDPKIQTRFDLAGKSIGVLSGSTIQSFVQKLPFEKKTKVYATTNDLIFAVGTGQVDATLGYYLMSPAIAKIYPKAGVHFGPVQWSIPVGAMLAEDGDDSLRLSLNAALAKAMNDGRYEQLSVKYFSIDVRCRAQ